MNRVATCEALNRLKYKLKSNVVGDEPLSKYTTLRVGGAATIFAIADSLEELRLLLQTSADFELPCFIMGKGSNLLVSDKGFPGIVVVLGKDFKGISVDGCHIRAGAGVPLQVLVQKALENGLKGLAFAIGIPGSLGGALTLNAGAHGQAIGDVVKNVTVYTSDCELKAFDGFEISFGYRSSSLSSQGVIVEAVLRLEKGEFNLIRAEMERYFRKRKRTQPLKLPNVGSIFKNPPGLSAGKLIEEVGCKGLRTGDAQVSLKHANFIVNLGNASAHDVYSLMRMVQEEVFRVKGILLEPEVTLVGDFE